MPPIHQPHTIEIVTMLLAGMGEKSVMEPSDRQPEIVKRAFDLAEEIQIEYRRRYGVRTQDGKQLHQSPG